MIWLAACAGLAAVIFGCIVIEQKKQKGLLTYPLWRGNMFIPWAVFALLCALVMGSVGLPRFIGLVLHSGSVQGTITEQSKQERCGVTYSYTVGSGHYTDSDTACGLKAGDVRTVYYDAAAPQKSTLYIPVNALRYEILAIALISLSLSTFIVVWFRVTHIIGGPKKS